MALLAATGAACRTAMTELSGVLAAAMVRGVPVAWSTHAGSSSRRAASTAAAGTTAGPLAQSAAALAAAPAVAPGKQQQQQQVVSPSSADSSGSSQVLGVLTALLQSQQQQHSMGSTTTTTLLAAEVQQQQQEQCSTQDMAAATSGVVRMESQALFDACWRRFKAAHGLAFTAPREIVWLNGAPGSGKGISTPHILKVRGMTKAICVSSLLSAAPEAQRFIEAGEMISDATVGSLLLEALLQPPRAGVTTADLNTVVDGFPRTAVQVDFVKLLLDKLTRLHQKYVDSPLAGRFPRPAFKVVVLYVDEGTSIQRQLQRAALARAHNARAKDAGVGEQGRLHAERPTDLDLDKAGKRYQIFKQHYSAILRLKQFLPFHLIDAMGSVQDTHEQITTELRYQSSLDLSEEAYSALRHLPLAKDLQQTARQQLVSRLEAYCSSQRPLFGRVLALLQAEVLPLLQQGALAGAAEWVSTDDLFAEHPSAVDMVLDVLADRGFKATYCREATAVPVSFDAASGAIATRSQPQHRFRFAFEVPSERDAAMLRALEIAARITESARAAAHHGSAAGGGLGGHAAGQHAAAAAPHHHHHHAAAAVTASFIPEHLNHEAKLGRVALLPPRQHAARRPAAVADAAPGFPATAAQQQHKGCGSCGSGDAAGGASMAAGSSDGGAPFILHRCLRPDLECGHSEALEAVPAPGN